MLFDLFKIKKIRSPLIH